MEQKDLSLADCMEAVWWYFRLPARAVHASAPNLSDAWRRNIIIACDPTGSTKDYRRLIGSTRVGGESARPAYLLF
jgi:hypothetical protein